MFLKFSVFLASKAIFFYNFALDSKKVKQFISFYSLVKFKYDIIYQMHIHCCFRVNVKKKKKKKKKKNCQNDTLVLGLIFIVVFDISLIVL